MTVPRICVPIRTDVPRIFQHDPSCHRTAQPSLRGFFPTLSFLSKLHVNIFI